MLNRHNIRNAAILKPAFYKCSSLRSTGKHSYAKTKKGYQQCVDCGKIKVKDEK